MKKQDRRLHISMNGIHVGYLDKLSSGRLTFRYEDKWLKMPGRRPISLSLPLSEEPYEGEVVYNFFDNLLPDNQQTRARIQSTFQIQSNHPFDILACIGKDCVGALQFDPEISGSFTKTIQTHPLKEKEIADLLRDYKEYPLGMKDAEDEFRISIAGAQEKSAFTFHKNQWCRPEGATPTTHIFKLPIGFIAHQNMDLRDSCENEWLCLKIAEAFGLPVARSEILTFEDVKVLSVERFDRFLSADKQWILRLPQEDMCQALGVSSNLKYQSDGGPEIRDIMNFLLGAADASLNRDFFYRAQILFWLLAGIDGHAKNFSVFIETNGKFNLTPLYDIMSAYPLIAKKQLQSKKIKMAMALKGKNYHYHWHDIHRRHFMSTAENAEYSPDKAESLLDEMLFQVDRVIDQVSGQLPQGFPIHVSAPIFEGMRKMAKRLKRAT